MKVLLINGSAKVHGCTYTALEEIVKELNKENIDTEILHIGKNPIRGCMACGGCYNGSGKCIFNDDIVNVALEKAKEADGFIFGSPVHYAGASGHITSFLDRFFYAGDGYQYKPGAVIVSCRRGGSTTAFDQLNKYLTISSMPVVSSQYWNMVHGNTPEEVKQDLEGLQTMRTLGRNMAWLLKSIQAGKEAGIPLPEKEERIATNFIR
ncbi:flavodoxin family protein [Anaerocolumna sp. AGMB13025]|uniref:flavodoxin family protein n=1 Tax=Anaerocolumna sp. AGMB13025 TaxID=3039116 RepID=UPI00241D4968|nr:flavodoxin family protein [Anaerocolumna sp. AGMB13025]WFR57470.1 flavodoxin family protein [Anaerocolumna sp. AGMB13025]